MLSKSVALSDLVQMPTRPCSKHVSWLEQLIESSSVAVARGPSTENQKNVELLVLDWNFRNAFRRSPPQSIHCPNAAQIAFHRIHARGEFLRSILAAKQRKQACDLKSGIPARVRATPLESRSPVDDHRVAQVAVARLTHAR
jgi:hypothetical protein